METKNNYLMRYFISEASPAEQLTDLMAFLLDFLKLREDYGVCLESFSFGQIAYSKELRTIYFKDPKVRLEYPCVAPEVEGLIDYVTDIRTEFYSLGIVMYYLWSGRLPLYTEEKTLIFDGLEPGRSPKRFQIMIERLTNWYPNDRYQSIEEIKEDLFLTLQSE